MFGAFDEVFVINKLVDVVPLEYIEGVIERVRFGEFLPYLTRDVVEVLGRHMSVFHTETSLHERLPFLDTVMPTQIIDVAVGDVGMLLDCRFQFLHRVSLACLYGVEEGHRLCLVHVALT